MRDVLATYVIGDIQGCYTTFRKLLDKCLFSKEKDELWLVGDLVNRGSQSAEVLAYLFSLDECVKAVLGNHDIHLICRFYGISPPKKGDTLDPVLGRAECADWVQWLRHQPLLRRKDKTLMLHAGVPPHWTLPELENRCREVEAILRAENCRAFLTAYRQFRKGQQVEEPWVRPILTLRQVTTLRTCDYQGNMLDTFSGPVEHIPKGYYPWFEVPNRKLQDMTVLFGHWSALGLHQGKNVWGLDSGCVWGNQLTALRLEDSEIIQVECSQ